MRELLFCDKCGHVASTKLSNPGRLCSVCAKGHYISTGLDFDKESAIIEDEYRASHNGEYHAWYVGAEIQRERAFYGKLDQNLDPEAVEKRKHWEQPDLYITPEVEEANRRWIEQERKKRGINMPTGPKCPSCGSTNLKKISTIQKVGKVKLFGLFGTGDLGKTYQCRKCGVKF